MKIAVLGGGVIGVASAWYLRRAGHEVTVIDRQAGPAMETSFANAGQISPGMSAPWAGNLSTAGGVVFTGDIDGNLIALDARTGKDLWHFQLGAGVNAAAMTYSIDGKQYKRCDVLS